MSGGGRNDFSAPKFLSVLTFFDYVMPRDSHLRTILAKPFYEYLPAILERNNISQVYISDSNRLLELKSLLCKDGSEQNIEQTFYPAPSVDQYMKDPKPAILEIFKHSANAAGSGQRFIFAHIPALDVIAATGNFNQAVVATRIIDEYLSILAKKILSLDGKLIITGTYGNAEKMVHRNEYELLNHRTLSPTPFLLISNQTKAETRSVSIENEAMYDIIRKKNNLIDIAPTILGLLNLPVPNSMTGRNLVGVQK
jgi:2,3-bisphosphoglycerate-independent phosphoglycerate mutase